ncbi:nuclear transport factor 2 family protein [Arthrobacter frigidicola]|nr:nuclear transport factor 2 family protein [Arthrobacter frigidicola]
MSMLSAAVWCRDWRWLRERPCWSRKDRGGRTRPPLASHEEVSALKLATALHAALEAGQHGEALRSLFNQDATTVEHPNQLRASGAVLGVEEMLAGSVAGASLLQWQKFDIHQIVENGAEVVLRVTWTGSVRAAVGQFKAGQVLRAHMVQFIRTRNGRIHQIETYDCYEPFEPPSNPSAPV